MDVRRVVTGHDADGKAVFVSDGPVAPITTDAAAGQRVPPAVGRRRGAALPRRGRAARRTTTYFPPVGGFRFGHFTLPPEGSAALPADLDIGAALAELDEKLPGMTGHMEPDAPGHAHHRHHRLRGGALGLRSPSSSTTARTVTLDPGDTVVQNGTRHRWSNPGDVPVVIAVFLIGAHHDRVRTRRT